MHRDSFEVPEVNFNEKTRNRLGL